MIGDAAQPCDDALGLGPSDGFAAVQMLASALDQALAGPGSYPEHLTSYHRWRDDRATLTHAAACALASYDWSVDDVATILGRVQAARVGEVQQALPSEPR